MPKPKRNATHSTLYALHRALGSSLNHLAMARQAVSDGSDPDKFGLLLIKDIRAAWRTIDMPGSKIKVKSFTKTKAKLKRTRLDVEKTIKATETLIKDQARDDRMNVRSSKKVMRQRSQQLIELLQLLVDHTSQQTPRLPVEELLRPITGKGTEVVDISFDIFCPRAYKHHTRLTIWMPRVIAHGDHAIQALKKGRAMLKACGVKAVDQYVIGLNSRVNQYRQQHVLMLDFDNMTYEDLPRDALAGEPGVLLRTATGFHFLGLRLYDQKTWTTKLRSLRKVASDDHIDLSLQRGYATLRMTASPRKPFAPIVYERWTGQG